MYGSSRMHLLIYSKLEVRVRREKIEGKGKGEGGSKR
jgi:hypothetical protein